MMEQRNPIQKVGIDNPILLILYNIGGRFLLKIYTLHGAARSAPRVGTLPGVKETTERCKAVRLRKTQMVRSSAEGEEKGHDQEQRESSVVPVWRTC